MYFKKISLQTYYYLCSRKEIQLIGQPLGIAQQWMNGFVVNLSVQQHDALALDNGLRVGLQTLLPQNMSPKLELNGWKCNGMSAIKIRTPLA